MYFLLTEKVNWRKVPHKKRPLIALVALDDDVRLGILPNSVKLVTTDCEMKACKPTEFKFQRGEVFLMHPALVHYGCAYKAQERSLRAHYYFDNPVMQRNSKGRETYLFQEVVQPMPANQCLAAREKKRVLRTDTTVAEEEQVATTGQDPTTTNKGEKKRTTKRARKEEAHP